LTLKKVEVDFLSNLTLALRFQEFVNYFSKTERQGWILIKLVLRHRPLWWTLWITLQNVLVGQM